MSNILYIPRSNPISFKQITPNTRANYLTKDYDNYPYEQTIMPWEEPIGYCQKVMFSDVHQLQFTTNYDPLQLNIINSDGISVAMILATQVRQNKYMPSFYIYEATINWANFPEGLYFVQLTTAGYKNMISEPIYLKALWENTINFEYSNSRYHNDVVFETGIRFSFRVEASQGRLLPGSNDHFYDDQRLNPSLLSSRTFNGFKLSIGGSYGVPDWVIEKMNLIWSNNNVTLDGISYAKAGDAQFTYQDETNYPMRGVIIPIREGINRTSKVLVSDGLGPGGSDSGGSTSAKKLSVQYNINSRIFGGLDSTGGSIPVIAFE